MRFNSAEFRISPPQVTRQDGKRRSGRTGHIARQQDSFPLRFNFRIGNWNRRQQRLCIWMFGGGEKLIHGRQFRDLAQIHYRHLIGEMPNHRQIVTDEPICQAESILQFFKQVDHLGLDGNIQRGDWLIADDQVRVKREGAGNSDPLASSPRKFVRIPVGEFRIETDRIKEFVHPFVFRGAAGRPMLLKGFGDDGTHGHSRVEACLRILKYHLHARAHVAQPRTMQLCDVYAVEIHLSGRRLVEAHGDAAHRRFAAAAFTDQAQGPAALYVETDIMIRQACSDFLASVASSQHAAS